MLIPIDKKLISQLKKEARANKRRRVNYNFHRIYQERVQRMLNVMCRDTYAQPHAHLTPPKVEVFIVLEGRAVVVEYSKSGKIKSHVVLDSRRYQYGVEIKPKAYHSLIPLSPAVVVYEVKEGPYNKRWDKAFADFAPSEENIRAGQEYNQEVLNKIKVK